MARTLTLVALLLGFGPPAAVALTGAGTPPAIALLLPVALALVVYILRIRVPPLPLALARRHPVVSALCVLAFAAATVQVARASVFAYDATRREYSVSPANQFRSQHNCMTSYAEGARFASEGGVNVYDSALYRPGGTPRRFGPLTVDPYHYPPPFLLLPAAVRVIAPEFFDMRRAWFGLQVLLLGGVMLWVAWWVGGDEGRRVAILSVACWAAPTTFMALQTGNFQITALPVAVLGVTLAWSGHTWPGGGLMAYAAASKIFPAMLVLHVVATRRWRVVAGVAVLGVVLAVVTAAVFGIDPYIHFLRDEVPRLASGAAFPQTEQPSGLAVNQSIYGFTVKLRALGASWLDQAAGKRVAQLYALLLAALALVSGAMSRGAPAPSEPRARLAHAAMWLGILNLASFASPFVGGAYGAVGTVWLFALCVSAAATPTRRYAWIAGLVAIVLVPWLLLTPGNGTAAAPAVLLVSAAWQVAAVVVNAWAAWPRARAVAAAPALV